MFVNFRKKILSDLKPLNKAVANLGVYFLPALKSNGLLGKVPDRIPIPQRQNGPKELKKINGTWLFRNKINTLSTSHQKAGELFHVYQKC